MNNPEKGSPVQMIIAERKRQVDEEDYSLEHDDEHTGGALALAAAIYATPELLYDKQDYAKSTVFQVVTGPSGWGLKIPYDGNVPLPNHTLSTTERIDQLVKSGALIIAEIERLQRLKDEKIE